jgi:hypothetical protein
MAWTQTDLDKLEEAIASGARRVKFADKEVEYRDLTEMMQVRDLMRQKLGKSTKGQRILASHSKGLDE